MSHVSLYILSHEFVYLVKDCTHKATIQLLDTNVGPIRFETIVLDQNYLKVKTNLNVMRFSPKGDECVMILLHVNIITLFNCSSLILD